MQLSRGSGDSFVIFFFLCIKRKLSEPKGGRTGCPSRLPGMAPTGEDGTQGETGAEERGSTKRRAKGWGQIHRLDHSPPQNPGPYMRPHTAHQHQVVLTSGPTSIPAATHHWAISPPDLCHVPGSPAEPHTAVSPIAPQPQGRRQGGGTGTAGAAQGSASAAPHQQHTHPQLCSNPCWCRFHGALIEIHSPSSRVMLNR